MGQKQQKGRKCAQSVLLNFGKISKHFTKIYVKITVVNNKYATIDFNSIFQ